MGILRLGDDPFDRTGELALMTRGRSQISNAPQEEIPIQDRLRLATHYETTFATVKARRTRGFYNCWGLALANRRTWVEDDYLHILKDDGFRPIDLDHLHVGDLVIYHFLGEAQHVAVVTEIELDGTVFVISQWGKVGEFCHRIDDVIEWLGTPAEYWTEREYD